MQHSGESGIRVAHIQVVVGKKDTTTMHEVPAQQIACTGSAKSLTLAAMSLGYGVVQLDVTIVNTALNSIGISFGGGISELQWVVSIYTITFAALILTAGALGDRRSEERRVGKECRLRMWG